MSEIGESMGNRADLPDDYVPALGFDWLTSIYDPVVQLTTRDTFVKRTLIEKAEFGDGMKVLDMAFTARRVASMKFFSRVCDRSR